MSQRYIINDLDAFKEAHPFIDHTWLAEEGLQIDEIGGKPVLVFSPSGSPALIVSRRWLEEV